MREVNMENVTYGYKEVDGKKEIDYEKWIDLSGLPRWKSGLYKGNIKWNDCIGHTIQFRYGDIKSNLYITSYNSKTHKLTLIYKGIEFNIYNQDFTRCKLGGLLCIATSDFKIKLGERINDHRRNITITNRKYIRKKNGQDCKYYKYKCNRCGFDCGEHYRNGNLKEECWILEGNLLKGQGCSCCCSAPKSVVPHINSIVAKEETKWMISYFQGGYDEAKKYSPRSIEKIYFKCPNCGEILKKKNEIDNLYENKSIGCVCSDGFSYPEKFLYSMLKQLNIDFQVESSNNTFNWCGRYRYDFYIPLLNCIIETHGIQHYENSNRGRTLDEEQDNDKTKRDLALKNGINYYIELDCRNSNLEWVKNSILNSELNNLFDLSKVSWLKCEEFTISSLILKVCQYWNNKEECETTNDLAKVFSVHKCTIRRYLMKGSKIGICNNYLCKKEKVKKRKGKKVEIFKDNVSLGIFESCVELERKSEALFGIKLNHGNISAVVTRKQTHHKGFTFKYIEESQNIAS